MIAAVLIAALASALTFALHCVACLRMRDGGWGRGGAFGLAGTCAALSLLHLFEIGLFAAGYELGTALGVGGFENPEATDFMDVYYFSLATFATLGLGKLMPTGHLAFVAGVEGLVGFVCITLTASVIFQAMQKKGE